MEDKSAFSMTVPSTIQSTTTKAFRPIVFVHNITVYYSFVPLAHYYANSFQPSSSWSAFVVFQDYSRSRPAGHDPSIRSNEQSYQIQKISAWHFDGEWFLLPTIIGASSSRPTRNCSITLPTRVKACVPVGPGSSSPRSRMVSFLETI
mmetsp:Transcript_28296/g.42789  ORF Transcript_28296/g.42789 Transcript_28296/m.42789 type:complete len:148 (-) Transcript_28296:381-824(-)